MGSWHVPDVCIAISSIVFFCEDGVRSAKAATIGYAQVYNVTGGTKAWIKAGYDVEALM